MWEVGIHSVTHLMALDSVRHSPRAPVKAVSVISALQ